jgi:hypothetical protein
MGNIPFRTKGYWLTINDNSKKGYHLFCQKCNTELPSNYKGVIRCKCDDNTEIIIPSCKKISTGGCNGCGVHCCKEEV